MFSSYRECTVYACTWSVVRLSLFNDHVSESEALDLESRKYLWELMVLLGALSTPEQLAGLYTNTPWTAFEMSFGLTLRNVLQ